MTLVANGWNVEARKYEDLFRKFNIPPAFHPSFAEFIDTGEAPREFLDYFDGDRNCQQAVEGAFALRVGALREAIQALHADGAPA